MSPEKQRIAIAKACGIKITSIEDGTPLTHRPYDEKRGGLQPSFMPVPNYLNDLNAMHEAEKVLSDKTELDQWSFYCRQLNAIACKRVQCGNTRTCGYTVSATAAQRAEAFLRTLNLWEEE